MQKISFQNINEDISFYNVYGMFQVWNKSNEYKYNYSNTARPNHGIFYVLCDNVLFQYEDGRSVSFEKGSLIYIPKGLKYKARMSDKKEECNTLLINFSIKGDVAFYDEITLLTSSASEKYLEEIYSIISDYRSKKSSYCNIMSSFFKLIGYISDHIEKKNIISLGYKNIQPAISYIDFHLNEKLYIPALAKMCHMSESCFRKDFKKLTGLSPNNYITGKRLEKAEKMLKNDDIPISSIVTELGFYDISYFYKVFTSKCGITPVEFRKNHNA